MKDEFQVKKRYIGHVVGIRGSGFKARLIEKMKKILLFLLGLFFVMVLLYGLKITGEMILFWVDCIKRLAEI